MISRPADSAAPLKPGSHCGVTHSEHQKTLRQTAFLRSSVLSVTRQSLQVARCAGGSSAARVPLLFWCVCADFCVRIVYVQMSPLEEMDSSLLTKSPHNPSFTFTLQIGSIRSRRRIPHRSVSVVVYVECWCNMRDVENRSKLRAGAWACLIVYVDEALTQKGNWEIVVGRVIPQGWHPFCQNCSQALTHSSSRLCISWFIWWFVIQTGIMCIF